MNRFNFDPKPIKPWYPLSWLLMETNRPIDPTEVNMIVSPDFVNLANAGEVGVRDLLYVLGEKISELGPEGPSAAEFEKFKERIVKIAQITHHSRIQSAIEPPVARWVVEEGQRKEYWGEFGTIKREWVVHERIVELKEIANSRLNLGNGLFIRAVIVPQEYGFMSGYWTLDIGFADEARLARWQERDKMVEKFNDCRSNDKLLSSLLKGKEVPIVCIEDFNNNEIRRALGGWLNQITNSKKVKDLLQVDADKLRNIGNDLTEVFEMTRRGIQNEAVVLVPISSQQNLEWRFWVDSEGRVMCMLQGPK